MAVRVKIEFCYKQARSIGVAIANSGYESTQPEVIVPLPFARERLRVRGKGRREKLLAVDKKEIELADFGEVTVCVITPDKVSSPVRARLYVSQFEDQILMSDLLIERLGLVLVKVGEGRWRFADDAGDLQRSSETKETYVK